MSQSQLFPVDNSFGIFIPQYFECLEYLCKGKNIYTKYPKQTKAIFCFLGV